MAIALIFESDKKFNLNTRHHDERMALKRTPLNDTELALSLNYVHIRM